MAKRDHSLKMKAARKRRKKMVLKNKMNQRIKESLRSKKFKSTQSFTFQKLNTKNLMEKLKKRKQNTTNLM